METTAPELPGTNRCDRPFWLLGPDPTWCVYGHFDDDRLVDRRHVSAAAEVNLSLADAHDLGSNVAPEDRWEPARLRIGLVQRHTEAQPDMQIFHPEQSEKPWVTCTLAEATALAGNLAQAAERGDEPLPTVPAPNDVPFWQTTACPAWCSNSHGVDDFYEDRTHADCSEGARKVVDLHLERAEDKLPEQLAVSVRHDYRAAIGVIELVKSEAMGVELTPGEARDLARRLLHFIEAGRQMPAPDSRWLGRRSSPTRQRSASSTRPFPCPNRILWCSGHSKSEIKDARLHGNGILHHGDVDSVPFSIGSNAGTVDVAVECLTGECRPPFAYVQIVDGDGGAELDALDIDLVIAALRKAKTFIENNHAGPVSTEANAVVTLGQPSLGPSIPLPISA